MTIFAPCRNYEGKTPVKVIRACFDTWGQPMFEVEALSGTPWSDAGYFGWSATNRTKFYPYQLKAANEPTLTASIIKTL